MELKHFYDVSQAGERSTFERRLVAMAAELEFPLVTAALVIEGPTTKDQAEVHIVGNTPQEFIDAGWQKDSIARDPVMRRLKSLSVPFAYSQALYVREEAADLWEEQAAFGYKSGVAVALHLPDHRHFLLGVDRPNPLPADSSKLTRLMADLQLLAVHAQDAAGRLLPAPASQPKVPTVKLSPREVEVLKWTMEGKSAWAVGQILSLSEHTVNFHLRNAYKKLGASKKTQAILKAVGLGLL
jgi:DNA-binding CsgD family transcriptional regulator